MAELGLDLREEIYAGQVDALRVLKHYCEEQAILPTGQNKLTASAETLRSILEPI